MYIHLAQHQSEEDMTKSDVWEFLKKIDGAQDFVRAVSAEFPIETIKASYRGEVVIYQKPEDEK